MTKLSLRTTIAVPAALCLAFGGALLAAGPASAAPLPVITVTAPSTGSTTVVSETTTTDVVAFSGTGVPQGDSLVVKYDAGDGSDSLTATVAHFTDTAGSWKADVTFDGLAAGATHVRADLTALATDGTTVDAVGTSVFDFAVAPSAGLATATTNVSATTIDVASTTGITVSGTGFAANEPIQVGVADVAQDIQPTNTVTATADANGDYTTTLILPASTPGSTYRVGLSGATSQRFATTDVAILGDPTITAPADGSKLVGKSVTFTGTATPGSEILVILDTTADFNAALGSASTPQAMMRSAKADGKIVSPKASDPTGTFLPVGASGTWSVTADDVPAGDYTFVVISQVDDGTGAAVVNESGDPLITGAGPVEFTLAAPAVTTTAATGPTLAFTGSQDAVPATIGGGLLLLVGAGLLVVARRRRHAAE